MMKSVNKALFKISSADNLCWALKTVWEVNQTEAGTRDFRSMPVRKNHWFLERITKMQIPKSISWNLIEGFHQARIVDARLTTQCINGREELVLRLIFEITSLVHPRKKYQAKKVYRSKDHLQIDADLDELLGDGIAHVFNLQGEIIAEGLVILEGMDVDIEIAHIHGKNHDEPFCLVTRICKPGGLIESFQDAA